MSKTASLKERVFRIIGKSEDGDRAGRIFDLTIMALIVLSIVSIILETFEEIRMRWHPVFLVLEIVTVAVFSVEYLLRIWTADLLYPDAKHPRLKYIFSFMAIVDLVAILPFYLPFVGLDLRFLRTLRLFRLLRIFKLGRYLEALRIISRVFRNSRSQLLIAVTICLIVILFSAILMYTVENPVQPEQFPNAVAALWWALCTLTTVGYGDVYPITAAGKLLASVISLVGIGIVAIPTGIIAAGFNREMVKKHGEEPEEMGEEELVALVARVAGRLKEYGYDTTISLHGQTLERKK